MNVHSHKREMSLSSLDSPRRAADAERRRRILEAAERAFVRYGFHATTMQHVADEIGMSAGNLYRYFPSKEAIVEGLCAVGQAERAQAFTQMFAHSGDFFEAICASLREFVLNRPAEKAQMIVETWAESGRNPRIAAMTRDIDAEVLAGLEKLFDAAKAAGVASPDLDSRLGASFFFTFVAGIFKRLAIEPAFDREKEGDMAIGVLKALFSGAIPASRALREEA